MMRRIERNNTGNMKAGQDLVIAGCAGFAGTAELLKVRRDVLRNWFSEEYLELAEQRAACNTGLSAELLHELGAAEYEEAGEGGVFAAIWRLSGAYEMGVEITLRQIPIAQETIEICERLELNPYRLYSSGCYLIAAENGGQMVRMLEQKEIPAAVVGIVHTGIAREILNAESRGFLERPQKDEILKVIPEYEFPEN